MREIKRGQKRVDRLFVAAIKGDGEVGEAGEKGGGRFVVGLGVGDGVINPDRGLPEICAGGKKKAAFVGRKHAGSGHGELF